MKQKRIEEIVCLIGIALIAIWVLPFRRSRNS